MSISDEKLRIEIVPVSFNGKPEKLWVKVTLLSCGRWFYPSFEDLYRMVNAISYCEDVKYPNGEGRDMVKRIMVDSVYCPDWAILADRYSLPNRSGGRDQWNQDVAKQLTLIDQYVVDAVLKDMRRR